MSGTEVTEKAGHSGDGRSRGEKRAGAGRCGIISLAALPLLVTLVLSLCGCGSKARQYAREARSSYVSARAVLVGVKEVPSRMEELLRSQDPEGLRSEAESLLEEARGLISAAAAAFGAVEEKCALLADAAGEDLASYADSLTDLVELNRMVINAYGEFIGSCQSALQGLPYSDRPQDLASALERMDGAARKIRELSERVAALEEEAESIYRRAVE